MKIVDLPITELQEATWNANVMDEAMVARLRTSIRRYGMLGNLVVRPLAPGAYEVLSGNHRLRVLWDFGFQTVPCAVVDLDDGNARLLSQTLNHLHGEDDLGLRAETLRNVLETIPQAEVLAVLPETAGSLDALGSLEKETIAAHLHNWENARKARLKHRQFQLTQEQATVVDEAVERLLPRAVSVRGDSPNLKGTALYLLCQYYIERAPQK